MDTDSLKLELKKRYISTYQECKKFGYTPTRFLNMVSSRDDIIMVTRQLIYKDGGTLGFETLRQNGRLDLSVERIILEEKFRDLFIKEDLVTAYNRLEEYGYPDLDQIDKPK
ncbi:MAG: hypothetical protein K2M42_07585 [Oscillospiraceae bacterium]|nr:hypothetical protein [Oscillospiraceae bacterium]